MLRVRLFVVVAVVLALFAGGVFGLSGFIRKEISVRTEEKLKTANEVVRLSARVTDYSMLDVATDLAAIPDLTGALRCPLTVEGIRDAVKEQTPQLDANGQPLRDALGRVLDTKGQPIEASPTACTDTSHNLVAKLLKQWSAAQATRRTENAARFLSERDSGLAVAREPDILLVSDAAGVVISRVGFDMDDWYGPSKPKMKDYPVVGRAETLGPQHDVIVWRDHPEDQPKLAIVSAAPLFSEVNGKSTFVGTVLVGFFVTNDAAEEARQLIEGADVAYFMADKGQVLFAGSSVDDPTFLAGLTTAAYAEHAAGGAGGLGLADITTKGVGSVYETSIGGQQYVVMPTAFSGGRADQTSQVGFVTFTNVTAAVAPVAKLQFYLPLIAVVLFVFAAGGILMIARDFTGPIEDISKGIQEVIAGRTDYMWPVDEKSYLSDMSHSLNVMSAKLQGKRDPDSEDAAGAAEWAGLVGGPGGGGGERKPGVVAGLGGIRGRRAASSDESSSGD